MSDGSFRTHVGRSGDMSDTARVKDASCPLSVSEEARSGVEGGIDGGTEIGIVVAWRPGHAPAAVLRARQSVAPMRRACSRSVRVHRVAGGQAASVAKAVAGVVQPSVRRGRLFSDAATRSISLGLRLKKWVERGHHWRSRPLVFSLVPRCHGQCGKHKYTGIPVTSVSSS